MKIGEVYRHIRIDTALLKMSLDFSFFLDIYLFKIFFKLEIMQYWMEATELSYNKQILGKPPILVSVFGACGHTISVTFLH